MLEVINRVQELYPIQNELDNVYKNQTQLTFSSPSYVIKCFEYFFIQNEANRLFFIVIRKEKLITSYLPLYIDEKNILRFLFDKHTDYCTCVGEKLDHLTIKELCRIITLDNSIKGLDFNNLLPGDPLLNYIRHYLGNGTVIFSYNNHSFLKALPSDSLLMHLKSKERSELKRILKKNDAFGFEIFDSKQEYPLDRIKALRNRMIINKTRINGFFDDKFIEFTRALYDAGELEIFAELDNHRFISASFVLINNVDHRIVWIDLFDNVPFINLSGYIEYIYYLDKNYFSFLSFGRGSYDYKSKNFVPQIENLYNLRYHKSKYNFMLTNFLPLKQFMKRLTKKS